jgi:hypothetical protein
LLRRVEREPLVQQSSRDDTGCPRCIEGGDSSGGNRREEPSLRGRDPRRAPGNSRPRSGSFWARSRAAGVSRRTPPPSSGASRERRPRDRSQRRPQKAWLLTRALITLGTMASARRKHGSARSNADGGSNLARRRIRGSYGCARASFRNGRNRMFGLRPPRCDELEGLTARRRARAGAQPPREHLARTLQGVSTSSGRRTKPSATRRRTFAIDEVRDGCPARGAHSARRAALESTPVEDVSGDESLRVRFTAARVEVASAGQANARSAERPGAGAGTATETSEVKIATRRTSEYLVSARAVPPKRAWSA